MSDTESKPLACDAPKTANNKGDGDGDDRNYDNAVSKAEKSAHFFAVTNALQAAVKMKCLKECPKKIISLSIDPPGTPKVKRNRGSKLWEAETSCAWRVTVTCVKKAPPLGGQPGEPGTAERPKRLSCDKVTKFTGVGDGTAQATSETAAQDTAKSNAEDDAYKQIQEILCSVKCPGRCPEWDVEIQTDEAVAGKGKPVKPGGWNTLTECAATCAWALTINCGQFDEEDD